MLCAALITHCSLHVHCGIGSSIDQWDRGGACGGKQWNSFLSIYDYVWYMPAYHGLRFQQALLSRLAGGIPLYLCLLWKKATSTPPLSLVKRMGPITSKRKTRMSEKENWAKGKSVFHFEWVTFVFCPQLLSGRTCPMPSTQTSKPEDYQYIYPDEIVDTWV